MAGSIKSLIDEVQLGSTSLFGDELLTALSSEGVEGLRGSDNDDDDDDDLDDISSLSLSDISALTGGRPTPIGGNSILVSDAAAADEMRRDMRRQAALFQERDEEARHQRQLLERKLQHTQQRHAAELNSLRAKLMQELGPSAGEMAKLKQEISSLRDKLSVSKEEVLAALPVSEERLRELQKEPHDAHGLVEAVQRHVGELLQQAAQTRDAHRREIEALRSSMGGTSREVMELRTRLDETNAASTSREIETGKRVAELQGTALQLQRENEDLKGKLQVYTERSERCEAAEKEADLQKERAEGLARELSRAKAELDVAVAEERARQAAEKDGKERADMLAMDKTFLQRELDQLREAHSRLEEKSERQGLKTKEAKRERDHLQQQLSSQAGLSQAHAEERLTGELNALRQRAEEEIREVKRATLEMHGRQLESAVQARDESKEECEKLRRRCDQLQLERDHAMKEHMQLASSMDEGVGEIRGRLRVREFEVERLSASLEDAQSMTRQTRLENDMYRDKVELLKAEIGRLNTEGSAHMSELEAALEATRSKLSAYQSIEVHLNAAVEGIPDFDEAIGEEGGGREKLLSITAGLPTDPQRRLVQIMSLASKVVEQQKQLAQARARVDELEASCGRMARELKDAHGMLDGAQQPSRMYVDRIRERDAELKAAEREVERQRGAAKELARERDELKRQVAQLRGDLQRALDQRHASEGVHAAIAELQQRQRVGQMRLQDVTNVLGRLSAGGADFQEVLPPRPMALGGRGGGGGGGGGAGGGVVSGGGVRAVGGGGGGGQPPALWFTKLKARVGGH